MHTMDKMLRDSRRILFFGLPYLFSISVSLCRQQNPLTYQLPCPSCKVTASSLSFFSRLPPSTCVQCLPTLSLSSHMISPFCLWSLQWPFIQRLHVLICRLNFVSIHAWNTSISLNHLEEGSLRTYSVFDLRSCLILILSCYPFLIIC
jgi:hypothetical protein